MVAPPRRAPRAPGRGTPARGQPSHPEATHIEPTTNLAYSVTPTTTTTVATTKTVTYTVSGVTAGDLLTLTLVDSTLIDGSTFTLDTGNRTAKLTAASNVSISAINGVDLGTANATRNFTAVGSTLTFDVASTGLAGSATPVVFKRSVAGDTTLNVNLDGVATENAGIGGMAKFTTAAAAVPAENANAASFTAQVKSINGTTSFTTDDGTNTGSLMTLATDTYKFGAVVIDKAKFYSVLSGLSTSPAVNGDNLTVVYVNGATASSPSSFTITNDVFPADGFATTGVLTAPTAVGNVVTEKYTNPISTSVGGTTFDLQRAPVVTGVVGTYVSAKTGLVADYNQTTFTETVVDGTYQYRMVYTAPEFSGTPKATSAATATVLVPPTASTAKPAMLRTYTTTNTSAVNNLSKGDVFKVVFDRAITAPVVGASLTMAGAQVFTYRAADSTVTGAVTFAVNTTAEVLDGASFGAGRVLTVTLLQEPTSAITFAATVPEIASFAGVGNSFGNATVTNAIDGLITAS